MNRPNNDARHAIMQSIRAHLAESARLAPAHAETVFARTENVNDSGPAPISPVQMFCERLESVGGHCTVVHDEREAARALTQIISELQSRVPAKRIALSDAPLVAELTRGLTGEELQIC